MNGEIPYLFFNSAEVLEGFVCAAGRRVKFDCGPDSLIEVVDSQLARTYYIENPECGDPTALKTQIQAHLDVTH